MIFELATLSAKWADLILFYFERFKTMLLFFKRWIPLHNYTALIVLVRGKSNLRQSIIFLTEEGGGGFSSGKDQYNYLV